MCARLDSNQRSRLLARLKSVSRRWRLTPYRLGAVRTSKKKPRLYAGFRYIPQIPLPFAKTVEALGTSELPRFFWFWENSSQTVVRDRQKKGKTKHRYEGAATRRAWMRSEPLRKLDNSLSLGTGKPSYSAANAFFSSSRSKEATGLNT